jgi:hypothetical protein
MVESSAKLLNLLKYHRDYRLFGDFFDPALENFSDFSQ